MSRLSPEAELLVRAGRAVLRPTDGDRERVLGSLLERTGGLPSAPPQTEPAPATSGLTLAKGVGVLAGLAVAGAGVFFALRPGAPPASAPLIPPASVQPVEVPTVAPPVPDPMPANKGAEPAQPVPPVLSVEELAPEARPRVAANRRSASRAEDRLAREVALLSRASSDLHAGRPAAALVALDDHAREFPNGALTQERAAGRARALCALGRTREAQVELARLTAGSPQAARAAQACAAKRQ